MQADCLHRLKGASKVKRVEVVAMLAEEAVMLIECGTAEFNSPKLKGTRIIGDIMRQRKWCLTRLWLAAQGGCCINRCVIEIWNPRVREREYLRDK